MAYHRCAKERRLNSASKRILYRHCLLAVLAVSHVRLMQLIATCSQFRFVNESKIVGSVNAALQVLYENT